ncbi:MAG: OmpA family protein [Elusimicrobiaceae bacterium]|nr:OmpA family protein [Elusimicrobiaceae bacterium]
MKRLIVVSVLFSLSLGANAYVQTCYYGKDCVNGQVVKTCDSKCQAKKAAKEALERSRQKRLAAQQAAALQAQREAEAAARRAQQEKDAAALAAIGKVEQIEDEISVILNNDILFQYGKTDLSKESKQTLDKAVELLNQIPNRTLVIQGHTDSVGSDEYNMELSEQRAKRVYDYMMGQGLQIKEVSYKGFGEAKPVADNNTKEGRQANRRVEFRIK